MLTKKQLELLDFIKKRLDRDGVPPSFDEMKEALNLRSKSGIHRLVTALEERGYIRRLAHRARAVEIVKLPDALSGSSGKVVPLRSRQAASGLEKPVVDIHAQEINVMGRIAAGVPIEAIQQVSHQIAVPGQMLRSGDSHYALEVKGDSMIEAGINSGDIVVISETPTAENGDIVVALVEGQEATLKRFYRRGASIALEAANSAYETRVYPSEQVKVQGRLVGLIRNYT